MCDHPWHGTIEWNTVVPGAKPMKLTACAAAATVMWSVTLPDARAQELKFTTQDFPPFSYSIDGVVSGPAVDIIERVCADMDATCSFQLLPWSRAQQQVRDGEANGMFVIGWNETRAEWVHFTPPIMNTEYGIFVNASNPLKFADLSDIAGYKVGVYGPSNTSNSLEKIQAEMAEAGHEAITIDMRPDDESGFKKLALNRIDAVFSNRDVGYALIAKLGLKRKIRYSGAVRKLKYYIGFSMAYNDKEVLEAFDEAYRKLHRSGEVKKILDKHSMEVAELK
jgi:polar amino acid transport system substrate-binding protein